MITNKATVQFCNEVLRPISDLLSQLKNACDDVGVQIAGLGGINRLPNTTEQIADGSHGDGDGRPTLNAQQARAILQIAAAVSSEFAGARISAIRAVSPNPNRG